MLYEVITEYADTDGNIGKIAADNVLYSTGLKSNSKTVERFRPLAPLFFTVGDCVSPRFVKQATYEGFCAGMDIL